MSVSETAGNGALLEGLAVQWRSIRALMVRDMMMRYGRAHLGFVWVVIEPMLLTAGVLAIRSAIRGPSMA